MGEFVEASLERLLPLYEFLQNVQLLSPKEVNEFVKRCRNYEYRLQKSVKDAEDFVLYAGYLSDVLNLIRIRRRRIKYTLKHNQIDGTIKGKIADIYRRCSLRFRGRKDIWRKRLDFLKKENMNLRCSKAFFSALKVYGSDFVLREEAARWEFKKNKSVNNARLHLQLGLRSSPEVPSLWTTLFEIEILNAKRLIERKNILTGNNVDSLVIQSEQASGSDVIENTHDSVNATQSLSEASDAVLDLKIAELVADQAMQSPDITDKNNMCYMLWRCAKKYADIAARLETKLFDRLWAVRDACEESWMAKYERSPDQVDLYELFDEACKLLKYSEKILRFYMTICEKRILLEDVFAATKIEEILGKLIANGYSQPSDYENLIRLQGSDSEKAKLLEAAVQQFPSSFTFWDELLRLKMRFSLNKKEMLALFNKAEQSVKGEDLLGIYQLAIDWAVVSYPSKVDSVFERAILVAPAEVASEVKCIRLRYLCASNENDPDVFRNEYAKICSNPPNSMKVHTTFINLEKKLQNPKKELIIRAMESCVIDFGYQQYDCWIKYAKYLLLNDPPSVSNLYQRAIVCIPSTQVDAFNKKWTLIMQDAESSSRPKKSHKRKKITKG